ncbi:MAG: stage V sporulation protein AC [Clostridiales bacterium]|nr:stage V sporulation protein AC [Clostridiales bacterium]
MKNDGLNLLDEKKYKKMYEKKSPPTHIWLNIFRAFFIGGLICIIAQIFNDFIVYKFKFNIETAANYTTLFMVFLGALLTALNIYDNIGKYAGAGSVVPITGFANSIVSPAMEYRSEGHILGVGAQMFIVAGPVLVFGVTATVLTGLLYYFTGLM